MKPLYRLTPHFRLRHNPLFVLEVRHVGWGGSAQGLLTFSQRRAALICGALLIVWSLLALSNPSNSTSSDFTAAVFAISLLAALPLDYTCMSAALGSFSGEISAGRWDLLRLTSLRGDQIVAAKHGTAQVRAWRWMSLIVGLRIAVVIMSILTFLFELVVSHGSSALSDGEALSSLIGQFVIVFVLAVCVIEPFWRMRALTALALAISVRTRQQAWSVLAAVGAVAAFWLVQGMLVAAIFALVSFLILPLALVESSGSPLIVCSPLLFLGLFGATIYGFYNLVQTWSLRRAERWIARLG